MINYMIERSDNMSENINQGKRETVASMYKTMLRYYIGQMKREDFYSDGSCEKLYKWLVSKVTKEIEEDPSKAEDYSKILEMFDRFYKVVTDEKVRNKVRSEIILDKEFTRLYGNRILGEFKRKYDMSHKYLEGSIAKKQGLYGKTKSDIDFDDNIGEIYPFNNDDGEFINIQQTGELTYTNAFGVEGNKIMRYKVRIPNGNDKFKEYVVFSDIDLDKMKLDDEYREAVLGELVNENNLEFSNCRGYIGSIKESRNNLVQMQPGEQREESIYGDYEYQVTRNYELIYTSEEVSAVMEYQLEKDKDKER